MSQITGKTLIEWGFSPGPWFGQAIKMANELADRGDRIEQIKGAVATFEPELPPEIPLRTNGIPFNVFAQADNEIEQQNINGVIQAMDALVRVPTVEKAVVMPDACPAGIIPVGGVVATKDAIHPGFHSADVCCSMAITVFKRDMDLTGLLNVAQKVTHFGPGKRAVSPIKELKQLLRTFADNRFLVQLEGAAEQHFMTQGDGNHFLFVGRLRSTSQPAIVTHHGSRGLGAHLYKRGMAVAQKHTAIHSPRTDPKAAWIDANSEDGRAYWEALQITRQWTKLNHMAIHDAIQQRIGNKVEGRFWNEHNFVFYRDGLYYHAKGATPSYATFSPEYDGVGDVPMTLIPMNMAEPILIARPTDNAAALGFAPHGAGRNMSRTAYMRGISDLDQQELFFEETKGLDVRSFSGTPDMSELPSAYKSADQVRRQIAKHNLAEVVDQVDPYGCIMAGEMHWQRKK